MPDVLFILGAHRSGSTVFERLLASNDGTATIGEAKWIWPTGFRDDSLCSCGNRFSSCAFWSEVRSVWPDGAPPAEAVAALEQVDRFRRLPLLYGIGRRGQTSEQIDIATELLGQLYDGIGRAAAGRLILDSSKSPVYARLLQLVPGVRVAYVHLIRDPRGVAHSAGTKKRLPEVVDRIEYLPTRSPTSAALDWNLQTTTDRLLTSRRQTESVTLRYEHVVSDPDAALASVDSLLRGAGMRSLGARTTVPDRAWYHSVSGNPVRFEGEPKPLRLDDRWRTELSARDRMLVNLITLPHRRWFGRVAAAPAPTVAQVQVPDRVGDGRR